MHLLPAASARPTRRAVPLLVALLLTGTGPAAAGQATPTPDRLAIREIVPVELPDVRFHALSPDGRWLFATTETDVCSYDAATLTRHACATSPFPPRNTHFQAIAFSPDGGRIAFTFNSANYFSDSDLMVFDLAGGDLLNLTDDGYEGGIFMRPLAEGQRVPVDSNPAWSPDGQTLAFARSWDQTDGGETTEIVTVPAAGGPATTVATVSGLPLSLYFGMRWLPDGERIAFVLAEADPTAIVNGLWLVDAASGATDPLIPVNPETGPPQIEHVTPRGEIVVSHPMLRLLLDDTASLAWTEPIYALVEPDTRTLQSFRPTTDLGTDVVMSLTAAPDGQTLLYSDTSGERLILHDRAGGAERDLFVDLPAAERPNVRGARLDWASNGTIFAGSSATGGVLIRLDAA